MNERAIEFSRYGDQVFGKFADCFPSAKRRRLAVEQRVDADQYAQIRSAMSGYISACLGSKRQLAEGEILEQLIVQRDTLVNYRSDGLLLPKREHSLEFTLLHKSVAAAFRKFGIDDHVEVIDLPINVRVVYGKVAQNRTNIPYSSSKVHADVWAGVPVDAVVVVMPILGDIENITIECGEMPAEQELEAMRVLPDYLDGRVYKMMGRYDDMPMRHGHVYMVDARLLHQTVRKQREGVRVSIDFRFRFRDQHYRAIAPKLHGPESMDTRVTYPEWLCIGTDSAIVFDETLEEARAKGRELASGAPYGTPYRLVNLFPPHTG